MEDNKIVLEYKGYKSELWINHKDRDRYYGNFYTPDDLTSPKSIDGDNCKYAADTIEEARRRFEFQVERDIECREYRIKQNIWERETDHVSVKHVFAIHPRKFEERVKEGKFDKSLLTAVKGGIYEVPLYYVTKAWDVLLKGSLPNAWMIGLEEEEDYTEEEVKEFIEDYNVSRMRDEAIRDNDSMKEIWKEQFGIDIDALDVDFQKFNMHIYPNVTFEEARDYFWDVPDGIYEWILDWINYSEDKSKGEISHDAVSSLMEYAADVLNEKHYND